MSGKWTERGIECEHEPSHLVADKDGVVVCNKRKPREEIPVGKMAIENLFPIPEGYAKLLYVGIGELLLKRLAPSSDKTPEVGAIAHDPEIQERHKELAEANAMIQSAELYAKNKLEALSARFRDFIYENGLAAPTIDALHDPKFGCPRHPKSRFLWKANAVIKSTWLPVIFYRHCLECSLNPKSLNEPVEGGTPHNAYGCEHCGIVLGSLKKAGDIPGHQKYYCKLCGTELGSDIS